jgi:hypothetical protein
MKDTEFQIEAWNNVRINAHLSPLYIARMLLIFEFSSREKLVAIPALN